ncbi:MAG TPA: S8 family serine peptidase, partial [candidate division Zixibacteria bacterium]|nr:S8 family serine peptidase [candidate division Zixibacteria bacterium]
LRSTFPDDSSFGQQWALHNTGQTGGVADADIDAPEAWDLTTSGTTADGDQIVIAIVDRGYDLNHPDISFFKNTHETPANGIDDDGNGYIDDYDGWDAYSNDGTLPASDHGTHVAGIAAAIGNNGAGVSGVNWQVKVMPIAGSSTSEATVVAAYAYALEMRAQYNESEGALGAFVVATNSSFGVDYGDPVNFPVWCAMFDSLGAYGVLSAAATANIGMDIDANGDVPTACPSDYLIAVTNTTSSDVRNSGAGWGAASIDLGAPGTSVYSTLLGGGYGNKTGTSMASPHVAGAVGFMYSAASPVVIDLARRRPDSVALLIRQAILDGVDSIGSLTGVTVTGGRLNLRTAAVLVQAIPTGVTIVHQPLADTRDTVNDYAVAAQITSDTTLAPDSLRLHYEIASVWTSAILSPAGGVQYSGAIPAQPPGTTIRYYLTAADVEGKADTTDIFTFRVIDYAVSVRPDWQTQTGLVSDTMWFDLWVVNTGLRADDYTLGIGQAKWVTQIFDSTMAGPISATGAVGAEDSVKVKVRVLIPASTYLAADTAVMAVLSTANPAVTAAGAAVTVSDGPALAVPFSEEFAAAAFDSSRWAGVVEAEISEAGLAEPSPPYSLNLDGNRYGADTVLSMAIDLRGQTAAMVGYAYQRTGGGDSPEAGDDLVVEYFDSTGTWRLIRQHLGADPDMTTFEEVEFSLPADAFHRRFRLRLRCTGTIGVFDDWFVDDVYVGPPPAYAVRVTPPQSRQYGFAGDTVMYLVTVHNRGLNTDRYHLFAEDLGGWPVAAYDSLGQGIITVTDFVPSGDSSRFAAKVPIPADAAANDASAARVRVVSLSNTSVADTAALETVSSGPPGGFPWYESFPEDTLIAFRWPQNSGATVTASAVDPPTPPYALDLDGGIDTVVSQVLNLSAVGEANLSFYYQRAASDPPEAGEDLWLEYKTSVGQWVQLDQLAGGGGAMNYFAQRVIPLVPAALHSGFQLRLRSFGSCANCDHWYIDDIRIDYAPDIAVAPAAIEVTLEQGDSAAAHLIIENEGLGGLDYSLSRVPATATLPFARLAAEDGLEPALRSYPDGFDDYAEPKGGEDPRIGAPVTRDAGGPDAYGYFWVDSDEPAGPTFAWIEASTTGINIIGTLTDDSFSGPY